MRGTGPIDGFVEAALLDQHPTQIKKGRRLKEPVAASSRKRQSLLKVSLGFRELILAEGEESASLKRFAAAGGARWIAHPPSLIKFVRRGYKIPLASVCNSSERKY